MTSNLRQCSHEFLIEFIDLYKNCPCLWKIKSEEYLNRYSKIQAYDSLVEKYKEVDPSTTVESIKKEINSLRSAHRRESAKVTKSSRSGAGGEDVYKPTLWYYKLLSFLSDQDIPRKSISNLENDEETEEDDIANNSESDREMSETPTTSSSSTSGSQARGASRYRSSPRTSQISRKRKADKEATTELMKLVGNKLTSMKEEDSFDDLGKHVANQLRSISALQFIIAQKSISDILYEAQVNTYKERNAPGAQQYPMYQDSFQEQQ